VKTDAGHIDAKQIIVRAVDPRLPNAIDQDAGAGSPTLQRLRDNECSQQQLVRLVGYRGPVIDLTAWDRQRRLQAALQGAS
jgi:hypothetical protein